MKKGFEHEKPCTDHKGNNYPSIKAMCKTYGIKPDTYIRRIRTYKWSIEKALTTPVKPNGGQYCYDHEGTRFKSESLMCEHWGVNRKTYRYRINNGMTMEEALTAKPAPGQKLKPTE